MTQQSKAFVPPRGYQRSMIRRYGYDPKNFLVIKETYTSLYLKDVRNGVVKILEKKN